MSLPTGTTDPVPGNNTSTATVTVALVADLSIVKTAGNLTPSAGGTLTYSLVISNAGPSTATGASFADNLPAGLGTITNVVTQVSALATTASFVTSTTSLVGSVTIPSGGGVTVTLQVSVLGSASGVLTNTATVSLPTGTTDPVPGNNTSTATVTVTLVADLTLTKVASSTSGTQGQTISYTVTLVNLGPSVASNVTLTDILSAGLSLISASGNNGTASIAGASVGATTASLQVGATLTLVVNATVTASSGNITNTAVGTSTTPDPTPTNTVTVVTPVIGNADVSTTLSVTGLATPGGTVTGTVTWINIGPSTAQNVTGTVVLPNGVTQTVVIGSLPVGSSTVTVVNYSVPAQQTAGVTLSWVAGVASTTSESSYANNTTTASLPVPTVTNATLSGRVWLDTNQNKAWNPGSDTPLAGYKVEVSLGAVVVGTGTTNASGSYTVSGLVPGSGYSVKFRDPNGNVVLGTPFSQAGLTAGNNVSTGTTTGTASAAITGVTLYAGDNVIEQNLPLDPSGVIYNSLTRQPVAGATVRLVGPLGFNPVTHLVGGTDTYVTSPDGIYQFLFLAGAPNGVYSLLVTEPSGYQPPIADENGVSAPLATLTVSNLGAFNVQAQAAPPSGAQPTGYHFAFNWDFSTYSEIRHNHIPLDPLGAGSVLVTKTGNKTVAEIGDSVQYTIRIRNTTGVPIAGVTLEDLLPAGFRYILGTARRGSVTLPDPAGGVGRALTFSLGGPIPANSFADLTYFVRLGVGSQQGDGINRATAVFPGPGGPVRSNTALFKVNVQGGVFSNEGCIIGKVYVDCDGNFVQNNDSGSRELGIPGVRIVMLDGSYVITDNEGKYSVCGVKSQTHVLKVDRTTLPRGARLVPSSNRNAGVGDSLFVDMKGGEMHRADFIEGSCTPEVLDQIKTRREPGGVSLPQVERNNPGPGGGAIDKPAATGVIR